MINDYENDKLPVDSIKNSFFSINNVKYNIEKIDNNLIYNTRLKAEIGWGPGKDSGTIGDQINWNWLLECIPNQKDVHLYLITNDGDYFEFKDDNNNGSKLNFRLESEWAEKKGNVSIHLYRKLDECLNDLEEVINEEVINEKVINLEKIIDEETVAKKEAILNLGRSLSFSDTHFLINEAQRYINNFNDEDIIDILEFFVENKQIHWLIRDFDVRTFFGNIFKRYIEKKPTFYQKKDVYIIFLKYIFLIQKLERSLYFYNFNDLCSSNDWSNIEELELFKRARSFFDLTETKTKSENENDEGELNEEENF